MILLLAPLQAVAGELRTAPDATPQAQAAVAMLREEIEVRAGQPFARTGLDLVAARREQVAALLPPDVAKGWRRSLAVTPKKHPEAYSLVRLGRWQIIAGDDDRGVLFGIGDVLRKLEVRGGRIRLPPLTVRAAPELALRAHQIGYRFKNNSYDAFTLPMFEQQVRDLAVFGANGVQWIAPVSDDTAESPLFHAPPLDMAIAMSSLMARYGLDFDLYYPEMGDDYARPETVTAELKRFEDLVRRLPKVDALYVPGGDPGHTPPDRLFPLVEAEAEILRRYHPGAMVWISGQGFDRASYERFYARLAAGPDWLDGVFFGPQSRDPLPVQRARIPRRYRMIFYPDIAHTMHAQFPVPQWDPAFALTEGREPVNPQPRAQAHIVRHFAGSYDGFVTYSEGVTDDVNKMLWSQLGWSRRRPAQTILADYARYFVGDARFAAGLMALESNWKGPVASNRGIAPTLALFDRMAPARQGNWRFDMAWYRATYDAYVQRRARAEAAREAAAFSALRAAGADRAKRALDRPDDAGTRALRQRLFDLAGTLYRRIGLQLSTVSFGASSVERGANLDHVDVALNDRAWLLAQIDAAHGDPMTLRALAEPDAVPEGGFYDDLGDPRHEPHLVRGTGFDGDPEAFGSAIDGIADRTPDDGWRMAWVTYAETLYEAPITLRYQGLNRHRHYRLKVVYAGEDYALPMRLTANGAVVQDFSPRTSNPMTVELDLPQALTRGGTLTLRWTRPEGLGGSGRGHQVAQVWLYPRATCQKV